MEKHVTKYNPTLYIMYVCSGAENEFDTTYHTEGNPTAPYDNSPYNPQYELNAYRLENKSKNDKS